MAKWRALYKQISLSTEVNDMSEFAQLLFDRALIHSDDWGVVTGDPRQLKWLTMPGTKRPPKDFDAALNEMVKAGLIWRYWPEKEDKPLAQFICFDDFQPKTLLQKRSDPKKPIHHDHRNYPDFPELSWKSKEIPRKVKKSNPRVDKSRVDKSSKAKRDSRLDHPSIQGYKELARLHVPIPMRDDWIACADEVGADKLLAFTKEWIGNGWNKRNVNGIMDYARNGGKSGARKGRGLTDQQRAFDEAAERDTAAIDAG